MGSKVNLKARINRHSRILKDSIGNIHPMRSFYNKCTYNIVFIFMVFLVPLYPTISSALSESYTEFYRDDIDESSILSSYDYDDPSVIISNEGFLSVNTIVEDDVVPSKNTPRYLSNNTKITEYTVEAGDSFASLAQKFSISVDTILWANNFDEKKVIHPGDVIKILPVTGVVHTVVKNETLSHISNLYDIDMNSIALQNGLNDRYTISVGQTLIIPDGKKLIPKAPVLPPPPKPAPKPVVKNPPKQNGTSSKDYGFSQGARSEYVNTDGAYQLVKRTPQRTFYWGNCTWFVAQYKNVSWGGNAKDWLPNAKKAGVSTGNVPTLGSIIVFHGKGYHPVYGHVGIVVDDVGSELIIKDMNYRRLNEVTTRKIPKSDPAIIGYIYVD